MSIMPDGDKLHEQSLFVFKGKLAFITYGYPKNYNGKLSDSQCFIWVMRDYGVHESWNKLFSIRFENVDISLNFFFFFLKKKKKVSMFTLGMVNFYLTRKSRKNPVMMKLKYIIAMSLRFFQMTLQLFHLTLKLYRRRILVSYDMLHI